MKRTFLIGLSVLLLPFFTLSQDKNPLILEEFAKGIKASNAFAFNEHLNIMQLTTDDDKFDLVAVNDKMQQVWKISLSGYGIKTDKFQNKIVALAASGYDENKGTTNTFIAYTIDPANGKVLSNKVIYRSSDEYYEFPQMYTGNGAFLKLAVRQSGFKRKNYSLLMELFNANTYAKELNDTQKLLVISYNDQLDSISSFKPVISNGIFVSLAWNKHADLFISWFNGPSIEVYKYDAGKTTPSNQLSVPVMFKIDKTMNPTKILFMQPSENINVVYYSLLYANSTKETELGVGKLDFETGKKAYVTNVLNKDVLKSYKKNFVAINNDIDDVNLGNANWMSIKYLTETEGKVIVAMSSDVLTIYNGSKYYSELNTIINGYDKELNLRFQQLLPTTNSYPGRSIYSGFHTNKNKLYIVANSKHGILSITGIYGCLNLTTGKWEKMEELSKKHISNPDYSEGPSILWFGDNFAVPYFGPKILVKSKYNITLQLNQY
jgi:hypothetical protein